MTTTQTATKMKHTYDLKIFNGRVKIYVDLNFARKLERERDEARNDLEFRRELYIVQTERLERVERERDALKQMLKEIV